MGSPHSGCGLSLVLTPVPRDRPGPGVGGRLRAGPAPVPTSAYDDEVSAPTDRTIAVLPGCEPYRSEGGDGAVLVCHGFSGSPISMRPWAEHLAAEGYEVSLPRLPGHGTHWTELNRTSWVDWYATVERELLDLASRHGRVGVAGLSMGGALALRLAERHPDVVAGLALVNPAVTNASPVIKLTGLLRHVVASVAPIGGDIAKPGTHEGAYDRTPVGGVYAMTRLWRAVRADLAEVRCPLLLFRSVVDHVVDPTSAELILAGVGSDEVTERLLHRSFHVATLDHDAPDIFAESTEFFARVLGRSDARPADGHEAV